VFRRSASVMSVRISGYAFNPELLAENLAQLGLVPVGSSTDLHLRLMNLALPGSASIIRRVTSGHRRWWIGSLIASCRDDSWSFDAKDLETAEALLARLLRVHNCGVDLPRIGYELKDVSFAARPLSDTEFWMATFDAEDRWFLAQFLQERLSEPWRRFRQPPGTVGVAPERDEEWDAWVRSAGSELATIESSTPALLTFIG
jgi:hypothetical protein